LINNQVKKTAETARVFRCPATAMEFSDAGFAACGKSGNGADGHNARA
jgi:hypothetical protein